MTDDLKQRLRKHSERFIFQESSKFANDLADWIEQLEANLAEAKDHIKYLMLRDNTWKNITKQRDKQLASVTAECDKLKADAMRYRWFRSNMHSEHSCDLLESQLGNTPTPEELDAVIDAAIAKGEK